MPFSWTITEKCSCHNNRSWEEDMLYSSASLHGRWTTSKLMVIFKHETLKKKEISQLMCMFIQMDGWMKRRLNSGFITFGVLDQGAWGANKVCYFGVGAYRPHIIDSTKKFCEKTIILMLFRNKENKGFTS